VVVAVAAAAEDETQAFCHLCDLEVAACRAFDPFLFCFVGLIWLYIKLFLL